MSFYLTIIPGAAQSRQPWEESAMENAKNTETNYASRKDYLEAISRITKAITDVEILKKIYEYAEHKSLHK